MKLIPFTLCALSLWIGCSSDVVTAKAELESKNNSEVMGEVIFTQKNGKVIMTLNAKGLTPGSHAIHIHEKADCSADDGSSAGGHWNPTHEPHGKWGSKEGFHRGDIGNFLADEKGNATMTFETNLWCLDCDDTQKNITNLAIIIHQDADDYTSQPAGNAGKRVSCGGVILLEK